MKIICLALFVILLSACKKSNENSPQTSESKLLIDSSVTFDSTSWFSPSPGDWWMYQAKMEGDWVDGTEYRDSIVSIEKHSDQIYLHLVTLSSDSSTTREWRIDRSGLVTQRIGKSDQWLFIAHTKPSIGSIVSDSLKTYLTECGSVPADSCVVYQQYDPNLVGGDSLANWTGIFQAKNVGVFIRSSSEIGDYLRSYRVNGEERAFESE